MYYLARRSGLSQDWLANISFSQVPAMVANALVFGAAESPEWYEPLERTVLEALKERGMDLPENR